MSIQVLCLFGLVWYWILVSILDMDFLSANDVKIVSPILWLRFYPVDSIIWYVSLRCSWSLIFLSLPLFLGFGYIKKIIANFRVLKLCLMFSSRSFIALGLILRSLIHTELLFVYGIRWVQLHSWNNNGYVPCIIIHFPSLKQNAWDYQFIKMKDVFLLSSAYEVIATLLLGLYE